MNVRFAASAARPLAPPPAELPVARPAALSDYALDPRRAADETLERLLKMHWSRLPALCLDSPPGAGKTGAIERLALLSMAYLRERCMIATQTNRQAFDLAERLARSRPGLRFVLLHRAGLEPPAELRGLKGLTCVTKAGALPEGPCVVVANATKWSTLDGATERFDALLVDEAYQLADVLFHQIANLARRYVLVGDPGQIAPVVTCKIERWASDPTGPHVACPSALRARHPGVARLALPVSRRLVPDTVRFVQPSFYPSLRFRALSAPGERSLRLGTPGGSALDEPLDRAAAGASLLLAELPAGPSGEVDEGLARAIAATLERLFARDPWLRDEGGLRRLTPDDVGVVCANVAQVHAVAERLPGELARGVLVETADRFQGLERAIMLAHHPLSGRLDPRGFHLDAGRLCVMLSRHRVACLVFARAGVEARLGRLPACGERVLGRDDEVHRGYVAHRELLRRLRREGRVVPLAPGACPTA
jgi:AAA domain-containing protein